METTVLGQPIYNGTAYRDELSAHWAVFLDTLKVRFAYRLGDSVAEDNLAPAFWLPGLDGFMEVKSSPPDATERDLIEDFVVGTRKTLFVFTEVLVVPGVDHDEDYYEQPVRGEVFRFAPPGTAHETDVIWDAPYWWCTCPSCGAAGIQFEGRSDRMACKASGCPKSRNDGDRGHTWESPAILAAYRAAVTAEFPRSIWARALVA